MKMQITPVIWVFSLLLALGCNARPDKHEEHADKHEEHAHEEHSAHDDGDEAEHSEESEEHGHDHAEPPLSELQSVQCSHNMNAVDCPECRYEVGVVKIPEGVEDSLITGETIHFTKGQGAPLNLRCEVGVDDTRSVDVQALASGRVVSVDASLGAIVKAGDVLGTLSSEQFAELILKHQEAHAALELAQSRWERLNGVQQNLRTLLKAIETLDQGLLTLESLPNLEIGEPKGRLITALSRYQQAHADWRRGQKRREDGLRFVAIVRGEQSGSLTELKVGTGKSAVLEALADVRLARKSLERTKTLSKKRVTSQRQVQQLERDVAASRGRLAGALETLEFDLDGQETSTTAALSSAKAKLAGTTEEILLGLDVARLEAQQSVERNETRMAVSHRQLLLFGLSMDEVETLLESGNTPTGDFQIRAPIGGTIVEQDVASGVWVEGKDTLWRLVDLTEVWVWCDVYPSQLHLIDGTSLPLPAQVRSSFYSEVSFAGSLDLLNAMGNSPTRTVKARIRVGNEATQLKPGMFVDATVHLDGSTSGFSVPATAVVADKGKQFLFVHWKDDLWVRRTVVVIGRSGDRLLVSGELTDGDEVASQGAFFLKSDVLREQMGAGCAD